jgi:hypothetical protein
LQEFSPLHGEEFYQRGKGSFEIDGKRGGASLIRSEPSLSGRTLLPYLLHSKSSPKPTAYATWARV